MLSKFCYLMERTQTLRMIAETQHLLHLFQRECMWVFFEIYKKIFNMILNHKNPQFQLYCRDKISIVRILLQTGCDVNAANKDGRTAIHVAAKAGFGEAAKLLLANNCSVNVKVLISMQIK